jgi:hypothetical protein
MTKIGSFRNVSLCEDVREEVGNKKSLMGVFSGDVVVSQFPAQIRVAFYLEYLPRKGFGDREIQFALTLGNERAAHGVIQIEDQSMDVATIIIPQGIAQFTQPGDIVLEVGVEGEMIEVLRKNVRSPAGS